MYHVIDIDPHDPSNVEGTNIEEHQAGIWSKCMSCFCGGCINLTSWFVRRETQQNQGDAEPFLPVRQETQQNQGRAEALVAVPLHMNGLQTKTLSKYEKRKGELIREEMFLEKRADEILNIFGGNLLMLSAVFMTASGALFAVGRKTFYMGFVSAFVMATSFGLGVVCALVLALQKFEWVKKATQSLQTRFENFYSQADKFQKEVRSSQTEGSGHGVGSHLQPLEEGSTSHSSSPSTSGSHVLFAAGRQLMPVEFRVEDLLEKTRINSFLGHYKKVIYLTVVLALVQGFVYCLIAYTVFQVVIIPVAFPTVSPNVTSSALEALVAN